MLGAPCRGGNAVGRAPAEDGADAHWMRRRSRNGRLCTDVRGATLPGRSESWKERTCDRPDNWTGAKVVPPHNGHGGRACSRQLLTRVGAVPDAPLRGSRRLAALITGLQCLALGGCAVFYVVELGLGEGSDATRVVMSAVLILVGAVGLGLLARGWLSTAQW